MFRFGAEYFSEHWPEDAKLMKAAGFNEVPLAEFAWSIMETEIGWQFENEVGDCLISVRKVFVLTQEKGGE